MLDDVVVLDLSWGIAGPMAGMVLADQGAQVTRIEPPAGDPFESFSGTLVWRRGKARRTLDLQTAEGREQFLTMVDGADVVLESFGPGVAASLGVDHASLLARNPRLIHCTIDGYGDTKHAGRPAYDALVAARTGQLFEGRGVEGTTLGILSGAPIMPGIEAPDDCYGGAPRPGPLFSGVPWPSVAAFYLATLGIVSALRARDVTGKGQHVHTSLLQGVLATCVGSWQRVEKPLAEPSFLTWVPDPRAPKGFFKTSDGAWTHHWVPLPGFILKAAEGDELAKAADLDAPRKSGTRVSTNAEDMVVLHALNDPFRDAVAKFPA